MLEFSEFSSSGLLKTSYKFLLVSRRISTCVIWIGISFDSEIKLQDYHLAFTTLGMIQDALRVILCLLPLAS